MLGKNLLFVLLVSWFHVQTSYGEDFPQPTQACMVSWEDDKAEFDAARATFDSQLRSGCYSYIFQQFCFCPAIAVQPYQVFVKGGKLIRPLEATGLQQYVLTMEQIFDVIEERCFSNCPDEGPITCDVTYGREGYVTSVFIDQSEIIADEEISYTVTDFAFCPP